MTRLNRIVPLVGLTVVLYGLGQSQSQETSVDAPLPPEEAAATMVVPEGFRVTLFAGEPDVRQPVGFCIDDRGRLWVAEAFNYPKHGTGPGDRILIFEDSDGDGRFDKKTVFTDQLNYVSGIEVGFGGAWVMSPPFFYFIPDRDGDDKPDGPAELLLDGFGNHANEHNIANGFSWGPDGWLYGTHGRTNWSMIGKPGTPEAERIRFDGGVWRYHPVRKVWEPFADGTTNPWGIDWDDYGEGFVCNCVDPHLFHVIQGAHYEPWRNRQSSEFAYERIPSIADHLHWDGGPNIRAGLGTDAVNDMGGGHAHCGTMVYLGDNWPDKYRNTVFMNNIHGKRINNDILRRSGSGYVATHGRDLMRAKDKWYMGVTLRYGPDGGAFASDWSDTGECHSRVNTQKATGRIFKITYGQPAHANVDLAKLSDVELAKLQLHKNDWYVQHARRLLQERAAAGKDLTEVRRILQNMFREQTDVTRQLRALWALLVIGDLDEDFLVKNLVNDSEYIRAWCVRILCEDGDPPDEAVRRFRGLASGSDSALVRLYLTSALQRLYPQQRWRIAEILSTRAEDASDQNLPLMLWYGIEPLVNDSLDRFVMLGSTAKIPLVRRHIARRAASLPDPTAALAALVARMGESPTEVQDDLLRGTLEGLEGRRSMPMPEGWNASYAKMQTSSRPEVRESALKLALIFDDAVAMSALRKEAADKQAGAALRNRAVKALVAKKAPNLAPLLLSLIDDAEVRSAALRGLAEYDDPATATTVLNRYAAFDAAARNDAVQTLASRPSWAMALLDAVDAKRVPRTDLTAFTARQLLNLKNDAVSTRVKASWGDLRETSAEKKKFISDLKRRLTRETMAEADRSAGRSLFQQHCGNCHKLFDAGGDIGPEITGAQRMNLDYLLENIVDPSASVPGDFRMQIIETTSGRVITGLVAAENKAAVTIRTLNEKVVIPTSEIETRSSSPVSMMPDGMLQKFSPDDIRDLIGYLSSPVQVPPK